MGIWAETAEREQPIEIEGVKFFIKKELDAGDREDLIDYMGAHFEHDGTALIRMGNMKLVQLAVVRIVTPEGEVVSKPTPDQIRKLRDSIYYPLAEEVVAAYPPLAKLRNSKRAGTSTRTTGSGASASKPQAM